MALYIYITQKRVLGADAELHFRGVFGLGAKVTKNTMTDFGNIQKTTKICQYICVIFHLNSRLSHLTCTKPTIKTPFRHAWTTISTQNKSILIAHSPHRSHDRQARLTAQTNKRAGRAMAFTVQQRCQRLFPMFAHQRSCLSKPLSATALGFA